MSQQKPHAATRKWLHRAVRFLTMKEGERGAYMNKFRQRDRFRRFIDIVAKSTVHGARPMISSR